MTRPASLLVATGQVWLVDECRTSNYWRGGHSRGTHGTWRAVRIDHFNLGNTRYGLCGVIWDHTVVLAHISLCGRTDCDIWTSFPPEGFLVSVPLVLHIERRLCGVHFDVEAQAVTVDHLCVFGMDCNSWRFSCKQKKKTCVIVIGANETSGLNTCCSCQMWEQGGQRMPARRASATTLTNVTINL